MNYLLPSPRSVCSMSSYQIQAMRGWDEELLLRIRLTTTQGCLLPALSHKFSHVRAPHSIGTKSDRFSSLLPKELGNSFGSCMLDLGPGQEVDLDMLMISRLAQSFRGMWTPGNLVKIILNSDSVCCCLSCCSLKLPVSEAIDFTALGHSAQSSKDNVLLHLIKFHMSYYFTKVILWMQTLECCLSTNSCKIVCLKC